MSHTSICQRRTLQFRLSGLWASSLQTLCRPECFDLRFTGRIPFVSTNWATWYLWHPYTHDLCSSHLLKIIMWMTVSGTQQQPSQKLSHNAKCFCCKKSSVVWQQMCCKQWSRTSKTSTKENVVNWGFEPLSNNKSSWLQSCLFDVVAVFRNMRSCGLWTACVSRAWEVHTVNSSFIASWYSTLVWMYTYLQYLLQTKWLIEASIN